MPICRLRIVSLVLLLPLLGVLSSCASEMEEEAPSVSPPSPTLRRLTALQYTNAMHALLGEEVLVPDSLEPDEEAGGLLSVGASLTTISPWGVEQYESAAYQVAAQVMDSEALRKRILPCTPVGVDDADCAGNFVESFGKKAWRRPLESDEVDRIASLAVQAGTTLADPYAGLEYALAALLQSPHFLFRVELGEEDPESPGAYRFTDWEMASRLSFFLWNNVPDDALLEAAASGELTTEAGLASEVDRMVEDPRSEEGLRNFFSEMLALYDLDSLNKDTQIYLHMSAEVGPAAREETLLGLMDLVFAEDADYREFFITQKTFIDRKLAAIYGVQAPSQEGFGEVILPEAGGRRGFLGQVSFLGPNAHPSSSSVTLRGKFVRERLLCDDIEPPPAGLNTSIPEASEEAPTMRERVAQHLADPYCAGCHMDMDPIGLGLENFDGLGGWRSTENNVLIDASSDLDGVTFGDAWGLAQVLHDHEDLAPCLVQTLFEYGSGHVEAPGEIPILDWHEGRFAEEGFKVKALLRDLAMSPAFRAAAEIQ